MSEAFWTQVLTLGLTLIIGPLVGLWVNKRLAKVMEQNTAAEKKIDAVTTKVEGVHKDVNSRIDQWKEDTQIYVNKAIALALARGKSEGVEEERRRAGGSATEMLVTAEVKAEEVLAVAKDAAKEVLTEAKKGE